MVINVGLDDMLVRAITAKPIFVDSLCHKKETGFISAYIDNQGNTIILVTHETFTAEYAKRIIKIRDGLIEEDKMVLNRREAHDGDMLK